VWQLLAAALSDVHWQSCIMREHILPAQALPMTSIPIKVTHLKDTDKMLKMKQVEKWNACIKAFRDKLISGQVPNELVPAEIGTAGGDETMNRLLDVRTFPTILEPVSAYEPAALLHHFFCCNAFRGSLCLILRSQPRKYLDAADVVRQIASTASSVTHTQNACRFKRWFVTANWS
jgi:hypothetical protein